MQALAGFATLLCVGMPRSDLSQQQSAEVAAEALGIVAEQERSRWEPRLRALMLHLRDDVLHNREKRTAAVFQHMDGLRPKLLLAMNAPAWQAQGPRGFTAASEARTLLTLWGDPRDTAVAKIAYRERKWLQPAAVRLAGATLDASLEKWRDYHFKREGITDRTKRTANWLRVLAKTDCCAYVEHHVRYRYWAYSTLLAVRKQRDVWVVHTVAEGTHVHFRETPSPR
jgi:hypothetical protein